MRKEKNRMLTEVAKIYGKNKSSVKTVEEEKEIHPSFAVPPQNARYSYGK